MRRHPGEELLESGSVRGEICERSDAENAVWVDSEDVVASRIQVDCLVELVEVLKIIKLFLE